MPLRPIAFGTFLGCALVFGLAQPVCASKPLTFELGALLNGTAPASPAPWLTATFETISPGTITLELQSHLSVPSEFIGQVALNLDPRIGATVPQFLQTSGPSATLFQSSVDNGLSLSGGGTQGRGFDILIDWSGSQVNKFDGFDTAKFTITGPATLAAQDFDFPNTLGDLDGTILIGAHIQGVSLPTGGTGSGAVMQIQSVPEPSSWMLLGFGGIAALAFRRIVRS